MVVGKRAMKGLLKKKWRLKYSEVFMWVFDFSRGWYLIDDFLLNHDSGDLVQDVIDAGYCLANTSVGDYGETSKVLIYTQSVVRSCPYPYQYLAEVYVCGGGINYIAITDLPSLIEVGSKITTLMGFLRSG